ncbi:MAG: pantetheine-phosphate adenylyltransferase [Brevinema sp.]
MRILMYPGTFDPPTKGHEDIALRALNISDKLIIAVGNNFSKNTLFSLEERVSLWEEIFVEQPNIQIISFSGLLVDTVKEYNASVIVRGLRVISDFEYELQIASLNHELSPSIDTVFFTAQNKHLFLSSTSVKEIGNLGGDISEKVSPCVLKALQQKFSHK